MTLEQLAAIITPIAAIIGALVLVWRGIIGKVEELHLSVNSRLDELVTATRNASLAEGREEGIRMHKSTVGVEAAEMAAILLKQEALIAAQTLRNTALVAVAELREAAQHTIRKD